MTKNIKKSISYKAIMLSFVTLWLLACHNEPQNIKKAINEFLPTFEKSIDIDLPVLIPCPDGWEEIELDAGNGYLITYCEPSVLSQSNPDVSQSFASPEFLPCPLGWTEVLDENIGFVTCHPFGPEGPMDCDGIDEAHFPGEPGCVHIGTECPEGPWAENLPSDRNIVYVQAGVSSAGDGSELDPFGSISEAIEDAGTDAIIALSKGTFDESVELPRGIVLWGACVAETAVMGSVPSEDEAVVTSFSPDTGVRNLQITGQRMGVLVYERFASAHLEDVAVNSTHISGITVILGTATVRDVIVRDTKSKQSDRMWGRGLNIESGGSVEVSRSVFNNNREAGISASGPTIHLKLHDVLVRNTQSRQNNGTGGSGFYI